MKKNNLGGLGILWILIPLSLIILFYLLKAIIAWGWWFIGVIAIIALAVFVVKNKSKYSGKFKLKPVLLIILWISATAFLVYLGYKFVEEKKYKVISRAWDNFWHSPPDLPWHSKRYPYNPEPAARFADTLITKDIAFKAGVPYEYIHYGNETRYMEPQTLGDSITFVVMTPRNESWKMHSFNDEKHFMKYGRMHWVHSLLPGEKMSAREGDRIRIYVCRDIVMDEVLIRHY